MSDCIPKRYPVYTVDDQDRIREYWDVDAWEVLRDRSKERRIFKKDLPKNFKVFESFRDYDV